MPYDRKGVKLLKARGARKHPFLIAVANAEIRFSDLARKLEVTPQSVAVWARRCRNDPNFLIPAERVPQLSTLLKVKPHDLRPDLYRPEWRFE